MGLVVGMTNRVNIPHEPGEWMQFRRLSWRTLQEASDRRTDDVITRFADIGGDMLSSLGAQRTVDNVQDDANSHDWVTVLRAGIVAWSYTDNVTAASIDDLDSETAEWAVREILAYSKGLSGDARGNGSSPSTEF